MQSSAYIAQVSFQASFLRSHLRDDGEGHAVVPIQPLTQLLDALQNMCNSLARDLDALDAQTQAQD